MQGARATNVIDRVNAVPLTAALLKATMRVLGALPPGQRHDFTARGRAMLRLLEDERPDLAAPRNRAAMLTALDFRIGALERLCGRPEYQALLRNAGHSGASGRIHDALLEVAAIAPLIACDGYAAFEPERFFRMALHRCKAAGRG